ncbi:cysteine--tRNA ligase [archaeon]|jgi:cysteinyl-tRNA synthetase|nr:cysteine--tRNA ligase [Candidatus Woesearchaeota archaeon]MBT4135877.1 cysteine--tRNA ligase [archaeon]MBT4242237.1 cysteine--tRNA ligase [archaeon]MBT4417925.1 cysteine--tRNA ligase [archaeon]
MLKLFNTLTRKKEIFKPIKKNEVKMYSCGLTVYNYGHIGNYRAFVASDILKRYLEYLNFKVKKIVNITDVDDKTIKGSIGEKKSLNDFTEKYTEAFLADEKMLNIEKSFKYPKATEHIDEMVKLIEGLLKKGFAYKTEDGIYFDIKKFKSYGKLSGVKLENLKKNVRVNNDEYDKENAQDFALWKFYDKDDGDVFWDVKIGKGRPGWHIECSAMSSKYLGKHFDIHTGGIDLVFPHHENEIAQSEAGNNEKFVNYWVHNEWMMVEGKKMSKSLGNYYTVRDIIEKGFSPLALRYFYLTGHYRSQVNFTLDNLKNAENSLDRLKRIISSLSEDNKDSKNAENSKNANKSYLKEFEKTMDDDLNTPEALQVLWKLVRDTKAKGKLKTIKEMDKIFGLDLLKKEKVDVSAEVKELINEREKARKEKDWGKADKLRDKIKDLGFQLDDTSDGVKVSKL